MSHKRTRFLVATATAGALTLAPLAAPTNSVAPAPQADAAIITLPPQLEQYSTIIPQLVTGVLTLGTLGAILGLSLTGCNSSACGSGTDSDDDSTSTYATEQTAIIEKINSYRNVKLTNSSNLQKEAEKQAKANAKAKTNTTDSLSQNDQIAISTTNIDDWIDNTLKDGKVDDKLWSNKNSEIGVGVSKGSNDKYYIVITLYPKITSSAADES